MSSNPLEVAGVSAQTEQLRGLLMVAEGEQPAGALAGSTATLVGFIAILLWSLLALLTAASGTGAAVPACGHDLRHRGRAGRGNMAVPQGGAVGFAPAAGSVGARHFRIVRLPRALLLRAAARAARGIRPDQLSLAAADRAVLRLPAGREAALVSRRGCAARADRDRNADRRPRRTRLRARIHPRLLRGLRRGLRVGDLFGAVAPLLRGADRCGDRILPGHRPSRRDLPSRA